MAATDPAIERGIELDVRLLRVPKADTVNLWSGALRRSVFARWHLPAAIDVGQQQRRAGVGTGQGTSPSRDGHPHTGRYEFNTLHHSA
jgi:hypothetical protein